MTPMEPTEEYPTNLKPVHPVTKPAARDSNNRPMVLYKGRRMSYSKAQRLATLEPLINRANSRGYSIPRAAEWLGYSKSCLVKWVKLLNIKWRRRNDRPKHIIDKTGWETAIKDGLKAGKKQSDIARELNVKDHTMSRFIKANGLSVFRKGRAF